LYFARSYQQETISKVIIFVAGSTTETDQWLCTLGSFTTIDWLIILN